MSFNFASNSLNLFQTEISSTMIGQLRTRYWSDVSTLPKALIICWTNPKVIAPVIIVGATAKYGTIDAQTEDLKTDAGLDSGLHPAVVCYMKARMFEDTGDIQKAQYFKAMYNKMVKQYPLRKSGVRILSVPRL